MHSNNTVAALPQQTNNRYQHQSSNHTPSSKKVCNYIREYFAVDEVLNIPEISIANFYEKIHKLRSILSQTHSNLYQRMRSDYPFQSLLPLTPNICQNPLQTHLRINQADVSTFSILEQLNETHRRLYFGQTSDQKKQGYALYAQYVLEENGAFSLNYFYEGFFEDDRKHGFGMEWSLHHVYIGNFEKDHSLSHQNSIMLFETGDIYVGSVKNSKRDGKGAYFKLKRKLNQYFKYQTSRKPLDYEYIIVGVWKEDELVLQNDFLMSKCIKELLQMDLFSVEANLLIADHSIYCGDLIEKISVPLGSQMCFIKKGKGLEYFSNGDVYRGDYIENKPQGSGHYFWSSYQEYLGQFKQGQRWGNGRWISCNGQQFQGEYKKDKRNGYGIYKWPNGDIYEGEFKQDVRNGVGKMSWSNGQIYVGHWKNGLQHGTGEIQVQLRSTSLYKKFFFDRGNPVIKKELAQAEVQASCLMKSKFQYKSRIREFSQQKYASFRKDKNQKSDSKGSGKMRKRSLGQLKLTKRVKLQHQEKARVHTQQKASFKIDRSFFQFRNRAKNNALRRKEPKQALQADKAFIKVQQNQFAQTQDQTQSTKYEIVRPSEPMQTQTQFKAFQSNNAYNMNKKMALKQYQLKQRRKTQVDLKMGDTLLRPIKWVNFKQSWAKS